MLLNLTPSLTLVLLGLSAATGATPKERVPEEESHRRASMAGTSVSFYAMGDAPYGSNERGYFDDQVQMLDEEAGEFLIHLGDLQSRRAICTEFLYEWVHDKLKKSPIPSFIVPGDNDWLDCQNSAEAWDMWTSYFHRFHENWNLPFNVRYQPVRLENIAWTYKDVLFIAVHVLGKNSKKNETEWNRIVNDNTDWTRNEIKRNRHRIGAVVVMAHALAEQSSHFRYWDMLVKTSKAEKIPILYLQGDTHRFLQGYPYRSKYVLRTVVQRGGLEDPLLVTVNPFNSTHPFSFQRGRARG